MLIKSYLSVFLIAFPFNVVAQVSIEAEGPSNPASQSYSSYADRAFPTNADSGDTHVHTMLFANADSGGTRQLPRDVYRFDQGDQVTSNTGQPAKLSLHVATQPVGRIGAVVTAGVSYDAELGAIPGKLAIGDGKLPPVGSTVNAEKATYTNDIGTKELLGYWQDDAFDPALHAVCYVRGFEKPSPRWTTYDAVRNGVPLLETVPAAIQERAWTSPIWYEPV